MSEPTPRPLPRGPSAPNDGDVRGLSLGTKIEILLAVVLLACGSLLFLVDRNQHSQVDLLHRERTAETARVLQRILALRAAGAATHADDYTRWDEFVTFTKHPDARWGRVNLTENIATFGIDAAWVLDDQYRLLFTANPSNAPAFSSPPIPLPELSAALRAQPIRHFYARSSPGLVEVWTSSIQPSDDLRRMQPSSGYYVIARLWTPARLSELSRVSGGTARIAPEAPGTAPTSALVAEGRIHVAVPLEDLRGRTLEVLAYDTPFPVGAHVHDALHLSLVLLVGAGLALILTVGIVLTMWVTRPLRLIAQSLRDENPSLLYRTIRRHDEFGQLAWLVREFFSQQQSLKAARRAAEEAGEAKQRFLTSISHELRTPMHGLLSFARFGAQDALTAERQELLDYFRQIDTGGSRLIGLLDELLDLAKFDAGRMKLEFAPFAIAEIAREAASEFAGICMEKKLALDLRIDPEAPTVVLDGARVRQVVRNLLSNAAKFTPPGGTIALLVGGDSRRALVVVEDSGAGVPPDELELIFGKFTQATNNRRGAGGTGLGLSLCREIVTAHGGRIWAENRSPRGTRMAFELPLEGPESTRHPAREAA